MRELLVVGPCAWAELGITPEAFPLCRIVEEPREADALALLRRTAVDVVLISPNTSASRVLNIARQASRLQPGVRVIVLARELTPDDVIEALRSDVYATLTLPTPPEELRTLVSQALDDEQWQSGIQVESATPGWISLRVSCRRVNAERLTHFMSELATDLPATDRHHLLTAFREVLLNAMEHGAGFDPGKVVEVHAVRTDRALVYYFKDPGPGFDTRAPQMVASEADPLSHLDQREASGRRAGGFGLLLTSKLVDELHFNEKGNEVILVKHLD
ncbi:MAG: ATP-binding protein [Vicinamibacterales bacterium]